jgi:hypothetical protein
MSERRDAKMAALCMERDDALREIDTLSELIDSACDTLEDADARLTICQIERDAARQEARLLREALIAWSQRGHLIDARPATSH